MRLKFSAQAVLEFGPSHLQVTQAYYAKYNGINEILLATPSILEAFHRDASGPLLAGVRKRAAQFTSDQLLRTILVMEIEELTYRATVIRIDDSRFLRCFVPRWPPQTPPPVAGSKSPTRPMAGRVGS